MVPEPLKPRIVSAVTYPAEVCYVLPITRGERLLTARIYNFKKEGQIMLSVLLSILVTAALTVALKTAGINTPTTVFFSVTGFIATFLLIGWLVRRKIAKVQKELEKIMLTGQQRIQRKVHQFQSKPGGNLKLIQRQLESDQKAIYQECLNFTPRLEPFKKWSLMMGRQIATLRMQFLYQLKEFEQVDAILAGSGFMKGPVYMEPMTVAMKIARQYKNQDVEGASKTFKKKIKWFRGDRGTILYGVMTWILVKEGKTDEARELLVKAKEATGHPTFTHNWEQLSNDRMKAFSNSGLGEEWYGLYLENPPQPKQQRIQMGGRKGRRF